MKVYTLPTNPHDTQICFRSVNESLRKKREGDCNKGTFGTLACVCGSYGMAGAAMLCASAAYNVGAGIVKLILPDIIYPIAASQLWECVFEPVRTSSSGTFHGECTDRIITALEKTNAAVLGCGLRVNEDTKRLTDEIIEKYDRPLVIDADALNCIADHTDILRKRKAPTIITPHPGEMARLVSRRTEDVQNSRRETAEDFAREHGCIVVLKGVGTLVTDGKETFVNTSGNGCLAKGGSGDVLAGITGSLLCQGTDPIRAAAAAVYMHGLAADECVEYAESYSVSARDIIRELGSLI